MLTGQPVTAKEAERGNAATAAATATTDIAGGYIPPDFSRTSFSWTEATPITFDYQSVGSYLSPNRIPEEFSGENAKYWLLNLKRINPLRYQSIVQGLWYSGYLGRVKNPLSLNNQQIQNGYEDFLGYTQAEQQLAKKEGRMVPSFTELLTITAQQGVAGRAEGGAGGGGPFRTETTSITEYNEKSVAAIANNAYGEILGRNATKKERQALAKILNQEQRKNPLVTISEGMRGMSTTDTTTTTRGGIVPTEIAQQRALEEEDFAERFFITTFTDMIKELAGPL